MSRTLADESHASSLACMSVLAEQGSMTSQTDSETNFQGNLLVILLRHTAIADQQCQIFKEFPAVMLQVLDSP